MPPLGRVNREAFRFYGAAKQIAVPSLERSAAGIIREGARGHFVIGAGHFDGFSSRQIVEGKIDSTATVMAGALGGGGGKKIYFGGGGGPTGRGARRGRGENSGVGR